MSHDKDGAVAGFDITTATLHERVRMRLGDAGDSLQLLNDLDSLQAENAAKDNEIGRLREALKFYAEPGGWILQHNSGFDYDVIALDEDRGKRATEALAAHATPPTEAAASAASADDNFAAGVAFGVNEALTNPKPDGED